MTDHKSLFPINSLIYSLIYGAISFALLLSLPAMADDASTAPGTLAYYLATNTAGYADGRIGDYGDMLEIRAPNSAGLDRLTSAFWSESFWLKNVHGLCATPIGFTNYPGGQGLATMISPRHFLCATHMHPEWCTMVFMDTNNLVYYRKTLQRLDVGNDTSVGILDQDLPPSVGFLPVLPANYTNYLPATFTNLVQGIGMNQDKCLFGEPMKFGGSYVHWNSWDTVLLGLTKNWNVTIRAGDSSNPAMLLISNQLVLVSHNYFAQGGPDYVTQIPAINQAMHQLSVKAHAPTDYQLTEILLDHWPAIH
jgi:hypothetical protein